MKSLCLLKNTSQGFLARLITLVFLVFLIILAANKASLFIISSLLIVALFYAFLRDKLWIMPVLALPSLALGEILYIPITSNWIYEARIAELFLVLTAAVFFLDIYLNNNIRKLKFDKLSFLLLIYFVLSLASFSYIEDFRYYVYGLKVVTYGFLAYFLALNLLDAGHKVRWFLAGLSATAFILSIQLFYKFYQLGWSTKFFFARNTISIPIGPIATASAILAFMVLVIYAFYLAEKASGKLKPFILTACLLAASAVFLTLGKAAIASMLLGSLFIFVKIPKSRLPILLLLLWGAILGYMLFNPFFSGLFERVKTTFVDVNTQFRLTEYETGWKIIAEHPWLGVGSGQQLYYFKKMLNFEESQLVNNFFLQAAIDFGLAGLALVLMILKNILAKIKKSFGENKDPVLAIGFTAALICAFFNGLAEVTIYALPYAIVFWLVMGAFNNIKEYEKAVGNHS